MGTLKRSQVPKERHLTRVAWMNNRAKDHEEDSWDWTPDIFTRMDPAPNFSRRALPRKEGRKWHYRQLGLDAINELKNSRLHRQML
jgi:hypothetical protein